MTKKPILLVCGCRKYEEYLHAAIRRFERPEWDIIGIVGGQEGKTTFNSKSKILSIAVPDTYEALPTKIHAAFSWISTNRPGIPGVFKTDDDMLFDMTALVTTLRENMSNPYWGVAAGVCNAGPIAEGRIQSRFIDTNLRPSHQSAAYCFGWGYWISASSIPLIVAAESDYKSSFLEDVCTGYVLNKAHINPSRIRFPYMEMPRNPELLQMHSLQGQQ